MLGSTAWGYKYVGAGSTGETPGMTTNQPTLRSEACAPATGLRDLEWNNVKSLIETAGSLWQDRALGRASYEVPIGGGVSSLYAGALWMGGISPDQQLKLAALTFRSGNDYWPGPLTTDGAAEVDKNTCNDYDDFFVSTRADAQRHRQWFDSQAEGTSEEDFPEGYTIPAYFGDYPAIGDDNQDYYLAPFKDYDGDGFMIPTQVTTLGTIFSKKSIVPIASGKTSCLSTVTATSTGFSTTKEMSTPSPKESPSAWKSVRPLHLRPTTRSTT